MKKSNRDVRFTLKPEKVSEFYLGAEEIAAHFVLLHAYWFTDPQNEFYQLEAWAAEKICQFITDPIHQPCSGLERYLLMKFVEFQKDFFDIHS